ncbi:hypothetical protein BGW80DRAFT_1362134 [Lactifluus volemus]|nr:hypothetical protein BGW80DRAFT_1362134 [Lactifluus volemus]
MFPERIKSPNSDASAKATIVSVLYSTPPLQLNAPLRSQRLRRNPTTTGTYLLALSGAPLLEVAPGTYC